MRTSVLNILCFLIASVILVWGALLVIGVSSFNFIPDDYRFLNLPSLAIVFGGILASVFISYEFGDVFKAIRDSLKLFSYSKITDELLAEDIEKIIQWQKRIKADRMGAIEELSLEYEEEFAGYLFSVLDTNYSTQELRELGQANIQESYIRQKKINDIISSMGKSAPVFGMLGTLFGLIVILSDFDQIETLLTGLAAALMTTLYGIIIGNFIFNPMARKMNNIASSKYFRKKLILEGVLLIEEGKTALQIYDKLQAHIQQNRSGIA
ncbi:motility protein A [Gracilimonas tropica]|uniref:motility protein A n=1 Tax=Gracilimonas tropica TaxID=454600 RepID=UPI000367C85C|nr:MotA/TolQ/ExbB proton channel family protein [Gracilimonas tropica]